MEDTAVVWHRDGCQEKGCCLRPAKPINKQGHYGSAGTFSSHLCVLWDNYYISVFQACFKHKKPSFNRSHSLQTHSTNIYFASVLHKSLSNMEAMGPASLMDSNMLLCVLSLRLWKNPLSWIVAWKTSVAEKLENTWTGLRKFSFFSKIHVNKYVSYPEVTVN